MGPLTSLLSLPVSGPIGALGWLARQVAEAAMQQYLDPARIEAALLALERRLEAGAIDEATFEAEEAALLEELAEMRAMRAARERGEPDPDDEPVEPEAAESRQPEAAESRQPEAAESRQPEAAE